MNDLQVLAALRDYRDRLDAADDWDLTDEGTWEEYAKPGGCYFGAIGAMREYLAELEARVDALPGGEPDPWGADDDYFQTTRED